MIQFNNVSVDIRSTPILKDISFSIPETGLTSVIGPNGAGKSTLLSALTQTVPTSAGEILIDDKPIQSYEKNKLARTLSILRQDNHLTARLTVEDLVTFGRFPYHKGRPTKEDAQKIATAIEFLGLNEFQHRFLDQLSGGQRQRAFIAMVLAQDTKYVCFDEPLNNLDMKHSQSIMKQLRLACDSLNKSIIVVLHDINFAASYSDSIIAMHNGRVFEIGSPEEIMQDNILQALYDMPLHVQTINGQPLCLYYS
ncbi:ABC transporter ATP-binding protein [Reinekea marinisedimentorum]|uniref:Iron complex transport system ATP-binding protein n=1 Tax=Reinekea marinisedimentorum TaxID=230495 RepID=A0A4R3HVY8_9GAMM|nr:ATP-binding cassette domain-containing protein [Reinekea marinisedimentorum]TCS36401.1 iron complex transport system ATP-binding protein [Reinekea marinisedimentorum]